MISPPDAKRGGHASDRPSSTHSVRRFASALRDMFRDHDRAMRTVVRAATGPTAAWTSTAAPTWRRPPPAPAQGALRAASAAIANSFFILPPSVDLRTRGSAACKRNRDAACQFGSYQSTNDHVLRSRYNSHLKDAALHGARGCPNARCMGHEWRFQCREMGVRAFTLCLNMETGVRRFGARAGMPPPILSSGNHHHFGIAHLRRTTRRQRLPPCDALSRRLDDV